MSKSTTRSFKIIGITVLLVGAIVITAGYILKPRLEGTIEQNLRSAGLDVQSVSVNFFSRSVTLDSVRYASPDSLANNPHQLFLQRINIRGIHILSFLRDDQLIINHVVLQDGILRYNTNFRFKRDTLENTHTTKISGIRIKHLAILTINAAALKDTTVESSATIHSLNVSEVQLTFKQDTTYSIGEINARLENFLQSKRSSLHSISISSIDYVSKEGRLVIDSFRIIPKYSESDFARIAEIQKTRLNIVIPKIICEGIKQARFIADSTLEIRKISIPKPLIHAYRDKHYPFVRDWIIPLPIEGIRRLPFKLRIDSIAIREANIAYEEFSENGLETSGTITFDRLDASIVGLNTALKRPNRKSFCTLVADCKVMNSGSLHATFKFPLNRSVDYQAYGSVRNMDLKSLNPALGNLSRIEIKEGTLNDLSFNFAYNDDVSKGEVLINYSDLDLTALKKNKVREENRFLSTVINTIVKSDKDKSVDKSKRIGTINIERDKKRFVFQFWWQSLLAGLQSTFTDNGKNDNDKKKKTQQGSSK